MLYEKNLEFEKNEKYLDTISLAFTDSKEESKHRLRNKNHLPFRNL